MLDTLLFIHFLNVRVVVNNRIQFFVIRTMRASCNDQIPYNNLKSQQQISNPQNQAH